MQWEEVWVWRECKYGGRAGKATVEALKRWQANREDTSEQKSGFVKRQKEIQGLEYEDICSPSRNSTLLTSAWK